MNMDRLWRRKAVKSLSPRDGGAYLDICTGTGDLALAVLARVKCRMLGMDFSRPMLDIARGKAEKRGRRLTLCEADALHLPIADASIDGAMVAFGVRNFEDLDQGLGEIYRVLKPGGRAVVVELNPLKGRFFARIFNFYFRHILPRIGRIVSRSDHAYGQYLPPSVEEFPPLEEFGRRMTEAGFRLVRQRRLTGGIAGLTVADKLG
ncbi:MAG: ubiquinone/menaquinone biosynthesis methyltransferase [Acidobacteriota bacterium]